MPKTKIPGRIKDPNPLYNGRTYPFFDILSSILKKDEEALENTLVYSQENPRKIGVLPTILLHPKVDIGFLKTFAEKHNRKADLGYLARTALELIDTVEEPSNHYKQLHATFRDNFYDTKRSQIEEIGKDTRTSQLERMKLREFQKHYETYRYFVYDGTTTPNLSWKT